MLTTSRGSFSAAQSAVAGAQSGTGSGRGTGAATGTGGWQHFTGADGQNLGDGSWHFALDPAPATVEWVDCDGVCLYEGHTPGFTWDGSVQLTLLPPGATLASDAELHVRTTAVSEDSTEAPEAVQ